MNIRPPINKEMKYYMEDLIFNLIALSIIVALVFIITRKLVMMWTGDTKEEATKKIQAFVSQKEVYHLSADQMLIVDLWNAIHSIIGDVRYAEICRLSRTSQMLEIGFASGLPYVAITVAYADENEKQRLENILRDIVARYLGIHGLCNGVLSDWKENTYVKIPALMIRYAETEEQLKILKACIQAESTKTIKKYQPLEDDDI